MKNPWLKINYGSLQHCQTSIVFLLSLFVLKTCGSSGRPNIIFILADDLGWNDVGFHGLNQIPTPNIDALAYSGLILHNYYVNPICTPSRSALMTGKYPIHTGMQHTVLYAAEPRGLPLTEKILPEYLKELGYTNHIVGKWHLGHYKREYSPLYRGFESHLGFWSGRHDYFDHTSGEHGYWGLDMRRGMDVAWDLHGDYSTDVFTDEAVKVIKSHNGSRPLFLYVAHAAVHSGNTYNPLPAPDKTVAQFSNITDYSRRRFAAMLSKLDDSVGRIVEALGSHNMLSNSIVIFSSDNGGPAQGFNLNAASNWPLRGVKNTLWEGGVRGAGLIWSPLLKKTKRVASQVMHITDWLPTLYTAAGGDSREILEGLDAIDIWNALSEDMQSNRTDILHNIDDLYGSASLTVGDYKIHKGTNYKGQWDSWYGPSGLEGDYSTNKVVDCKAGKAIRKVTNGLDPENINRMRSEAKIDCRADEIQPINCSPMKSPCLFNIKEDPCELRNLAKLSDHYDKLKELLDELARHNSTAVPPTNLPDDPRADPKFWEHTWTNFADYSVINYASR